MLKKVLVLPCVIGLKTYGLLYSLISPAKPGDMDYKCIVDELQVHLAPKPLVIAERYCFHKHNHEDAKSMAQYVALLKRLSEHCSCGAHLEDAQRDRVVCELNSEVQRCLLTRENFTFQKVTLC